MPWDVCLWIVIIVFLAGIEGILDEFQFHQPLISCSLIGLVSGYLTEGLILGGTLQFIALGWANVGASVAPDVTLASIVSSILMVLGLQENIDSSFMISCSILVAIPLSLIGLSFTKVCRNLAIRLVHQMDEAAKQANFKSIERYHICGILMQGVRVLIPTILMLCIPSDWIASIMNWIPVRVLEGIVIGTNMASALGFAIVIHVLSSKEIWPFFAAGFVFACIQSLTEIGLSVIGVSLMLIYMAISRTENYKKEENQVRIPLDL